MSSTTLNPRNYNPSKAIVVRRVPTFSFKPSNKSSLGHEDDDQVMLLHDKSNHNKAAGCKLGDSCNNNIVLKASVLVPRGHGSDGNEVEALQKESGRERLKRHREEVAGRVTIPDKWGKEELLKDWIDYSSFDSLLAPNGLASARKALMAERRRTSTQPLRIGSIC
ncbi:uncharacterized protein LOC111286143 [Durio zibethinus]|uniref:Uncharacterized protein LOC111286143 n=1 Tax=Durio zibethinus TaxID=66656 RepID=A0A6P5XV25_DURZI|nr:uncharacterized protein LOC111286143 [Durio zibethinus]